jgi:hypothetical protein
MAIDLRKLLTALIAISVGGSIAPIPTLAGEPEDQAVIVYLKLTNSEFGLEGESFALYDIEDAVEAAIGDTGRLDGHEIGGGYYTIFTYGRDADELFGTMRSALDSPLIRPGSSVLVRHGGPDVPADWVALTGTCHPGRSEAASRDGASCQ